MPASTGSGRGSLPSLQVAVFLLYPHMKGGGEGERERERELVHEQALWSPLIRSLLPSCMLTLMTSSKHNYQPKAPPPNTIAMGLRVSKYEFWRDTNIQSMTIIIILIPQIDGALRVLIT